MREAPAYVDLILVESDKDTALVRSDLAEMEFRFWREDLSLYMEREGTDGSLIERTIPELEDEEAQAEYVLIGPAVGKTIFICLYLACKYEEDFFDKLSAFSVKELSDKVFVKFYGERRRPN